jgi:hypothetical protein
MLEYRKGRRSPIQINKVRDAQGRSKEQQERGNKLEAISFFKSTRNWFFLSGHLFRNSLYLKKLCGIISLHKTFLNLYHSPKEISIVSIPNASLIHSFPL